MFKNLTISLFLLIFTLPILAQRNDNDIRINVLKKSQIDSLYIFGKWDKKGNTETHLKYLGQVKTKDGRYFKIMNFSWFWGLSKRATSRILIFNDQNEYLGNYMLNSIDELPIKLENGKLIFNNLINEECDKNIITIIDLSNGLPKQILIKCKYKYGGIYEFE